MKNLMRATLILALLITNKNFSQEVEVDSILPVMLDEVIVSTPFGETADENVVAGRIIGATSAGTTIGSWLGKAIRKFF